MYVKVNFNRSLYSVLIWLYLKTHWQVDIYGKLSDIGQFYQNLNIYCLDEHSKYMTKFVKYKVKKIIHLKLKPILDYNNTITQVTFNLLFSFCKCLSKKSVLCYSMVLPTYNCWLYFWL